MSDKEKLLEASKIFKECGDLYEELANIQGAEDTEENNEKLERIAGKLMFKLLKCQELAQ